MSIYNRINDGEFNASNESEAQEKQNAFKAALREEFGESWWNDSIVEEIESMTYGMAYDHTSEAEAYEKFAKFANMVGRTAMRNVE